MSDYNTFEDYDRDELATAQAAEWERENALYAD